MASWLTRAFGRRAVRPMGILLYGTVQEVILVERLLRGRGFQVRMVAPPPEYRVGCDLAVEFDLLEQEAVETVLAREASTPLRIVSTKEMLPDVMRRASFAELDGYLMCRAGNMKLTVDVRDHRIVNVSGGGCPDIPGVARELHGVRLEEARDPVDLGHSLCAFLLQMAFDALKARLAVR